MAAGEWAGELMAELQGNEIISLALGQKIYKSVEQFVLI